ncbi:hypothetical protein NKH77_38790 [Streptomyces sp. M19]
MRQLRRVAGAGRRRPGCGVAPTSCCVGTYIPPCASSRSSGRPGACGSRPRPAAGTLAERFMQILKEARAEEPYLSVA